MYVIINKSTKSPSTQECDAIETVIYNKETDSYIPSEKPDGFKALVIERKSPSEEYYIETVYVFDGHTMKGNEPIGEITWVDDEELQSELIK